MARPSYGSATQARSRTLFSLLLDYANDEIEDSSIEALRPHIQAHWQTERRLVIRTKVRILEALSEIAKTPLNSDQIKEALRRWQDFLEILEDNRPNRGGSEIWHFTLNLWHSRNDREANLQEFDRVWEMKRLGRASNISVPLSGLRTASPDFQSGAISHRSEDSQTSWSALCKASLESRQRLTTNPLTSTDGLSFDVHDLYVPLGLIERQDEDEESILTVQQFLDRLPTSHRIAIVGEPGAGKTTLLQQIATWLLDQDALPIWVSLADLQGETLEQYLLQTWLKQATRKVTVSIEQQEAFAEQFRSGKVWLLLDAIDEMAIEASVALTMIARQLRGWIEDAHVVLTCRSNVWDNGKNALEDFRTYQNLSFREQIGEFIDRWFRSNPALGTKLRQALSERRRIRDAVRNPLRLALLCRSWSLNQGSLPSTKATLYQQFVEAIYTWKQDYFPTSPAERKQLNRALSKVALSAISNAQFRLSRSFLQQAFDSDLELMPLALQLGWLNQVSGVYAFYHSSFQEYFTAQAIDDWQFFFNGFVIFQSHWREVVLLWLGRTDLASLIEALIRFDDRCGGFYSHRAFFLAASGLSEFPQSRFSDEILMKLLLLRFGQTSASIREAARLALVQTDRQSAIAALEEFVQTTSDFFARWTASYTLGKTLDFGNSHAIAALIKSLDASENVTFKLTICDQLGKIDPENPIILETLQAILATSESETIQRKAAYVLGKATSQITQAISILEALISNTQSKTLKLQAAENLIALNSDNAIALSILNTPTRTQPTSTKPRKSNQAQIERTIATLEHRLSEASDPNIQRRIAYRLATLSPGHEAAISKLLTLLSDSLPTKRVVENLREVLLEEHFPTVIRQFKTDSNLEVYKLLWYCSEQMSYQDFEQAWNS
jgi:HEAT repeat protein